MPAFSNDIVIACDRQGTIAIYRHDIVRPVRIAHLTDLHVLPPPRDDHDAALIDFLQWQGQQLGDPNANLQRICRQVAGERPDVVIVSGDMVDLLDRHAHQLVVSAVQAIGAPSILYARGNHEFPWSLTLPDGRRLDLSQDPFERYSDAFGLAVNHETGKMDYTAEVGGLRVVVFDTCDATITGAQADKAERAAGDDAPFLLVTHVPLPVPSLEYRAKLIYGDVICTHVIDSPGARRVIALTERPNCLAVLTGHLHMRSEDAVGRSVQLLTTPGAWGGYRIIDLLPADCERSVSPTTFRRLHDPRRSVPSKAVRDFGRV